MADHRFLVAPGAAHRGGHLHQPAQGKDQEIVVEAGSTSERSRWATLGPGLVCAIVLGLVGSVVGMAWPLVGGPVIAVALGVLFSPVAARRRETIDPGLGVARTWLLQAGVVLLGVQLSLQQLVHVGATSLPVLLGTVIVALALAWPVGRALRISGDLRTLVGVGTAICGVSAIAAVTPVIRAKHPDTTYAISTIFVLNIVAVLVFPPLGALLDLSQTAFGVFAGTAVNDTSSVVAAAASYGAAATDQAVVVKLVRSLMIIPIVVVLAVAVRRRDARANPSAAPVGGVRRVLGLVPWFLVGFVAVAAINSLGWVPDGSHELLRQAAVFLIAVALAAIGLSTDVRVLRQTGPRPLVFGFVLWLAVSAGSLILLTLSW